MPNSRTRFYVSILIGLISVLLTILLFLTAVSAPANAQWAGFYSLIFSEVLTTISFAFLESRNRPSGGAFGKAGIYISTLLYLLASTALALVYMVGMAGSIKWLLSLHGALLGLLFIVITVVVASSRTLSVHNANAFSARMQFEQLANRLNTIRLQNPNAEWVSILAQCQEAMSFFNYSYTVPVDARIETTVAMLEKRAAQKEQLKGTAESDSEPASSIHDILEELAGLIAQRKMETCNRKGQL